MKKNILFLTIPIILFAYCANKSTSLDIDTENSIDSIEKIKVIKLEKSRGIIFPAEYTKEKIFAHAGNSIIGFFTPEEKTVRYIDENLALSFHLLTKSSQRQNANFKIYRDSVKNYDKQFVAYVDSKNDSIILVRILNFESDPYKFHKRIENDFIVEANEWPNTNTLVFKFLKHQKSFISAYE